MGKFILAGGLVLLLAIAASLLYNLNLEFDPQPYQLPPLPQLIGPLKPNNLLRNAQILLKGQILGPESLLIENGTIYTGTWDGKLLKIVNGIIEKEFRLVSQPEGVHCGLKCVCVDVNRKLVRSFHDDTESKCGRPLGIRRLNAQLLVLADAYFGVFTVDIEKGISTKVFDSKTLIDGQQAMFLNDLDVLDENTVFVSISSTRWDRRRFLHAFLEQKGDGRVLRLDIPSGKAELVLKGLNFANGIQILPDRQSLIVSECSMARIIRFYFDGPKKGNSEIFIENLPGFPDNIRKSSYSDNYYVGLAGVRHSDEFSLFDFFGPRPFLRKLLVKLIPDRFLAKLFTFTKAKYGLIVEFDVNGKLVRSFHDPSGVTIPDVSQASDDETHLYIGSFHADFIAKIPKKGL